MTKRTKIKSEVIIKQSGGGFFIIVKDQYTSNQLAITHEELKKIVLYGLDCVQGIHTYDLLKSFISQEILRVREEAYEDGRNEKAPMGVSQWKNHGDKYEYAKFWEKKIREEERERIIGIVDQVFEKGHGGGNWRRLVFDLKDKIKELC